jgi:hypothetical protein
LQRADYFTKAKWRYPMGFGKGALLWLLGDYHLARNLYAPLTNGDVSGC